MKRVCFISTVHHNVGDDFVREGILCLFKSLLGEVESRVVHKHFPATTRGEFWRILDQRTRHVPDWLRWRSRLSDVADFMPVEAVTDAVLSSDLVIQAGTPVYWKNDWSSCARTEWFEPLIRRRWKKHPRHVPLLNLGAGSCQSWGSDGSEIIADARCRKFIQEFTSWSTLTTVRDELARRILHECGHDVPMLPCPSILAPESVGVEPGGGDFVALNYMPYGGHYDLNRGGPHAKTKWEQQFCSSVKEVARNHPCLVVCHDKGEVAEAARLFPEIPRFYSEDWREYLHTYSRCRAAVVNRVHAAVVSGAMGRRALLIGNDSRLLTASEVPGVTILPVSDAMEALPHRMRELLQAPATAAPLQWIAEMKGRYLDLFRAVLFP